MDTSEGEVVLLACQAIERPSSFKNLELTLMITPSFIVLAPFDRAKVERIRRERAADARAQGASRFQQMWYGAQAPFAMVDGYMGMTLAQVLAELPSSRTFGRSSIQRATLTEGTQPRMGPRTAVAPAHRLVLRTEAGEVSLQVDGHVQPRELRRLLGAILGDLLDLGP